MKDSDAQRLHHIKTYCEDIADSIVRFGAVYEIFAKDRDYFNSVSMCLMQIGELSRGLSDEFKDETRNQIQWGSIKAMRNLFAHAYAAMSRAVVWETAMKDIPELLRFCDAILEKNAS
jgi:uncharacterized protein with HEPN domain